MSHKSSVVFGSDEDALLKECKRIGPTGISPRNVGRANFATTYSTSFCELVADLVLLYKCRSIPNPITRLSEQFRRLKVDSCRGAEMTYARVEYLVNVNVARLRKVDGYRVLDRLVKQKCPLCGLWKRGLVEHLHAVHPDAKRSA